MGWWKLENTLSLRILSFSPTTMFRSFIQTRRFRYGHCVLFRLLKDEEREKRRGGEGGTPTGSQRGGGRGGLALFDSLYVICSTNFRGSHRSVERTRRRSRFSSIVSMRYCCLPQVEPPTAVFSLDPLLQEIWLRNVLKLAKCYSVFSCRFLNQFPCPSDVFRVGYVSFSWIKNIGSRLDCCTRLVD